MNAIKWLKVIISTLLTISYSHNGDFILSLPPKFVPEWSKIYNKLFFTYDGFLAGLCQCSHIPCGDEANDSTESCEYPQNDHNGHRTSKLSEPQVMKVVDLKFEDAI